MEVVDQIYNLRHNFIVIGLTGRTGSGCTTVADILKTENIQKLKSNYKEINSGIVDNNVRKNRIVHNFICKNWKPFTIIRASDVIFYYAFLKDFDMFVKCLEGTDIIPKEQSKISSEITIDITFKKQLDSVRDCYNAIRQVVVECEDFLDNKKYEGVVEKEKIERYRKLVLHDIAEFRENLDKILAKTVKKVIAKELQKWGNNIRKYNSIAVEEMIDKKSPSCLARKINQFIKMFRAFDKIKHEPTLIVIDALRNPYEILYFRERYSAFYTISVNTEEKIRQQKLFEKGYRLPEVQAIDEAEQGKHDFQDSYQLIDIHCWALSPS